MVTFSAPDSDTLMRAAESLDKDGSSVRSGHNDPTLVAALKSVANDEGKQTMKVHTLNKTAVASATKFSNRGKRAAVKASALAMLSPKGPGRLSLATSAARRTKPGSVRDVSSRLGLAVSTLQSWKLQEAAMQNAQSVDNDEDEGEGDTALQEDTGYDSDSEIALDNRGRGGHNSRISAAMKPLVHETVRIRAAKGVHTGTCKSVSVGFGLLLAEFSRVPL